MLDFQAVREKQITLEELISNLTKEDLFVLTNEMIDMIFDLIKDCTDDDVVFVPDDPDAYDPFAENEEDMNLPWTLGHVVVHINASSEESAALASELARGVEFHGRSRYEIPWQSINTIDEINHHLEESRRICLSSLNMWPNEPHLDNYYQSRPDAPRLNAIGRFVYGLSHADSHINQIENIVYQTRQIDG
jgi:hypothetical protein